MLPQPHASKGLQPVTDWNRSPGEVVEIRISDDLQRRGRVDQAMPDGSGLWLAANGAFLRTYIHRDEYLELWAEQ